MSDLISRSELKKKIEEVQYTQEFCIEHQIDYSISMQMLEMVIDNAPTVSLQDIYQEGYCDGHLKGYTKALNERPQGEWIEKVERRGCFAGDKTVYSYTCPFCGVKEFKKYPFCHCGAKMKGEGDNDQW